MKKSFVGACHCSAVRFEADLVAGTFKCNCPMCTKTRLWAAIVAPADFRLIAGSAELKDYQPDRIHHVFCAHCGVRPFGWGDDTSMGGKFYAVRLACLEGLDVEELIDAPITCYDGRHDRYDSPPAETRHL